MHQLPARVWNEIARTQKLKTSWAKKMFPLQPDAMDSALADEEERVAKQELNGDYQAAAAYLKIMPLLWERMAVQDFLKDNPSQMGSLVDVTTAEEAVILAGRDFTLTGLQKRKLHKLFKKTPTLPPASAPRRPRKVPGLDTPI